MTNALRMIGVLGASAVMIASCTRESRNLPMIPGGADVGAGVRQVELQPGQPLPPVVSVNPHGTNPQAIEEGKRLYHWYNCSGCHFAGGGGMGPPLMDDDWIYGSEPENIYNSIMEGRPEGMPSFRGHLPQDDAWKIVAYVQSLAPRGAPSDRSAGRARSGDDGSSQGARSESGSTSGSSGGGSG